MSKRRIPDTISGQLRWFLQRSGQSTYALEKATGVDNAAIGRFLRAERGLALSSVDPLADRLKLRLTRIED